MQLRSYRELAKLTLQQVADGVGLANPTVVRRHERGDAHPDATTIERYRAFTQGAVTERDWHELRLEREQETALAAAQPQSKEQIHAR
tara:strand:+ start:84 stop:347 length:264 start_codon:yes stop_codon:yes gene_type:complete